MTMCTSPPGGEPVLPRPRTLRRMLGTFAFVCAAWAFFRAETLGEAGSIFKSMTGLAAPQATLAWPQAALEVLVSMVRAEEHLPVLLYLTGTWGRGMDETEARPPLEPGRLVKVGAVAALHGADLGYPLLRDTDAGRFPVLLILARISRC